MATPEAILKRYRKRWGDIDKMVTAIRECPFCGNGTGFHDESCILAPVEVCGKRIYDAPEDEDCLCRHRQGHDGECE